MYVLVCICMYSLDICFYYKNVKKVILNFFYLFFLFIRRNFLLFVICFKVWDDQFSSEVVNWIKSCKFEYQMKGRGENLVFDMNFRKDEELINSFMKVWYDEIKDYNYVRK